MDRGTHQHARRRHAAVPELRGRRPSDRQTLPNGEALHLRVGEVKRAAVRLSKRRRTALLGLFGPSRAGAAMLLPSNDANGSPTLVGARICPGGWSGYHGLIWRRRVMRLRLQVRAVFWFWDWRHLCVDSRRVLHPSSLLCDG